MISSSAFGVSHPMKTWDTLSTCQPPSSSAQVALDIHMGSLWTSKSSSWPYSTLSFSAVESHYHPHTVLVTPLQSTKVPVAFLSLQLKNQVCLQIGSHVFWGQNCQAVNECSPQLKCQLRCMFHGAVL